MVGSDGPPAEATRSAETFSEAMRPGAGAAGAPLDVELRARRWREGGDRKRRRRRRWRDEVGAFRGEQKVPPAPSACSSPLLLAAPAFCLQHPPSALTKQATPLPLASTSRDRPVQGGQAARAFCPVPSGPHLPRWSRNLRSPSGPHLALAKPAFAQQTCCLPRQPRPMLSRQRLLRLGGHGATAARPAAAAACRRQRARGYWAVCPKQQRALLGLCDRGHPK